ncbi:hypothetical protein BGZ79_005061 [Entomortierella chlamydospora]|nr:hypothetical protein BGZ79_005061 [Entomortierella chlamydospora]
MFRPTIFFIALSVIFFGFLSTGLAAAIPNVNAEVVALGETFQELRQIKGHFDGGEYNADVDGFNGEKHQVMLKLADAFGKPGVLSADITSVMGPSDEIPAEILAELKRSAPQVTPPTNFQYILYKWRGYHDYLWFRINMRTKKTQMSAWYAALE